MKTECVNIFDEIEYEYNKSLNNLIKEKEFLYEKINSDEDSDEKGVDEKIYI